MTISRDIQDRLAASGLTAAQLARMAGVDRSTIWRYIHKPPKQIKALDRILGALEYAEKNFTERATDDR